MFGCPTLVEAFWKDLQELDYTEDKANLLGGNVTGLSVLGPQIMGKLLELLKKTIPALSVAILGLLPNRRVLQSFREAEALLNRWATSFYGRRSIISLERTEGESH